MGSKVVEKAKEAERREQESVYWGICGLGLFHEERCEMGLELMGLKLRPPRSRGDDWMCIVTANRMGVAEVLYISGGKPELLLIKALGHLERGDGDWRADKYARGT